MKLFISLKNLMNIKFNYLLIMIKDLGIYILAEFVKLHERIFFKPYLKQKFKFNNCKNRS